MLSGCGSSPAIRDQGQPDGALMSWGKSSDDMEIDGGGPGLGHSVDDNPDVSVAGTETTEAGTTDPSTVDSSDDQSMQKLLKAHRKTKVREPPGEQRKAPKPLVDSHSEELSRAGIQSLFGDQVKRTSFFFTPSQPPAQPSAVSPVDKLLSKPLKKRKAPDDDLILNCPELEESLRRRRRRLERPIVSRMSASNPQAHASKAPTSQAATSQNSLGNRSASVASHQTGVQPAAKQLPKAPTARSRRNTIRPSTSKGANSTSDREVISLISDDEGGSNAGLRGQIGPVDRTCPESKKRQSSKKDQALQRAKTRQRQQRSEKAVQRSTNKKPSQPQSSSSLNAGPGNEARLMGAKEGSRWKKVQPKDMPEPVPQPAPALPDQPPQWSSLNAGPGNETRLMGANQGSRWEEFQPRDMPEPAPPPAPALPIQPARQETPQPEATTRNAVDEENGDLFGSPQPQPQPAVSNDFQPPPQSRAVPQQSSGPSSQPAAQPHRPPSISLAEHCQSRALMLAIMSRQGKPSPALIISGPQPGLNGPGNNPDIRHARERLSKARRVIDAQTEQDLLDEEDLLVRRFKKRKQRIRSDVEREYKNESKEFREQKIERTYSTYLKKQQISDSKTQGLRLADLEPEEPQNGYEGDQSMVPALEAVGSRVMVEYTVLYSQLFEKDDVQPHFDQTLHFGAKEEANAYAAKLLLDNDQKHCLTSDYDTDGLLRVIKEFVGGPASSKWQMVYVQKGTRLVGDLSPEALAGKYVPKELSDKFTRVCYTVHLIKHYPASFREDENREDENREDENREDETRLGAEQASDHDRKPRNPYALYKALKNDSSSLDSFTDRRMANESALKVAMEQWKPKTPHYGAHYHFTTDCQQYLAAEAARDLDSDNLHLEFPDFDGFTGNGKIDEPIWGFLKSEVKVYTRELFGPVDLGLNFKVWDAADAVRRADEVLAREARETARLEALRRMLDRADQQLDPAEDLDDEEGEEEGQEPVVEQEKESDVNDSSSDIDSEEE